MMYVIKYKEYYCRFKSYSSVDLMSKPEQGTLYNLYGMANARLKQDWHIYYTNLGNVKITIKPDELEIYDVQFKSKESKVQEA